MSQISSKFKEGIWKNKRIYKGKGSLRIITF